MEKTIQQAKDLMEKGWKAREDHKFEEAEQLLNEAKEIFEQEQDWFNVTECLNHLAYNEKLQAGVHAEKGYRIAKESLELANEKGSKDVFANRAVLSLSDSMCLFESSMIYALKSLETYGEGPDKADILAHIARIHMRTGNLPKAQETIKEAFDLLEKYYEQASEPHKYIWKCTLLLVDSLIKHNAGDKESAKAAAEKALSLATEKDLKTRITQAKLVLETVSN